MTQTYRQKKGLVLRRVFQLLDRPVGYLPVILLSIVFRIHTPVYQGVSGSFHNRFFRPGEKTTMEAPPGKFRPVPAVFFGWIGVMVDLASGKRHVAVLLEILRQSNQVFVLLKGTKPGTERIDAGGGGP